jgi:hypothetical protein
MFPFQSGSPLLNQWAIKDLLPVKWTKKQLEQLWARVRHNLEKSRDRMELRYNRNRKPQPFKVGDLVFYKNHPLSNATRHLTAKLMPRYKGPFKIAKFLTPVTVRLVMPNTGRFVTKAHVSLLKPGGVS